MKPPTYVDNAAVPEPREVLAVLTQHWKVIAFVTAAFLFFGVAASFLLVRPSYTSIVVFLSPHGSQTLKPIGSGLSAAMLNSPSLNDRIIQKLQLQTAWKLTTFADAREALKSQVQIEVSTYDVVKITVRDHNARLASDIANEYLNGLNALDTRLAESDAADRYGFLDRQAKQENDELRQAEDRLQELQRRSGLIDPSRQTAQAILNISQLHAVIAARAVDLQSMRRYASDTNPGVIQLRATIAQLERQLSDRQNDASPRAVGDIQIPAGNIADLALQHQRALREVTLHSNQSGQVMLQLAQARMNLMRTAPAVLVIDRAIMADYRSGPQRLLLWLASCWAGFFTACLYVFLGKAMALSGYDAASIRRLLRPKAGPGLNTPTA
ncbi:Wzz/FepE/Etk N-terminal domain-containing protein [Granulicella tundricola]|uniref:Wzz/FepE/Etk N-terminal domain-containing protein n=1 Tax=Granulicella tundricola TaxID=940615 RepID=UPI0018DCEC3C|nr:Wzz/FepE/Etk N-terminal domain-containing protein [Granulicella tundricola]